jgi:hypothetical protein
VAGRLRKARLAGTRLNLNYFKLLLSFLPRTYIFVFPKKYQMSQQHIFLVAQELSVGRKQVEATLNLLDEGATVPFISRYRKEVTGSLDELQLVVIKDWAQQLKIRLNDTMSFCKIQKLTDHHFLLTFLKFFRR